MSTRHSLASYRGFLFAAWKDEAGENSGDDCLYYGQFNTSSREWARIKPAAAVLPGNGNTGVSLATDGKTLFAAWKGRQQDSQLSFCMMFGTGMGWASPTEIPAASSPAEPVLGVPALAVMDKTLYAAWVSPKAEADGRELLYSTAAIQPGYAVGRTAFPDASSTAPPASRIPGAFSSSAPSLGVSDDGQTLYAAWIHSAGNAPGGDGHIWVATFKATEGWSTPSPLAVRSAHAPSIAAYKGETWLAWQETHDQTLRLQKLPCLLSGATGVAILPEFVSACAAPAIAECNGKLYAMWRDTGTGSLSLARFDAVEWSALEAAPKYR